MKEPPTIEQIIRHIENRKDKFTHVILNSGKHIEAANGDKYEIHNVVHFGEFGDIYAVLGPEGKMHHMRTEVAAPPRGYQSFPIVAALIEDVIACKDPFVMKHFVVAENCKCDRVFKYIFTPQIGPSVADVRRYHVGTNFSSADALNLTIQCYFTVEYLHSMGYIHGDLTLSSFCFGMGDKEENLYLTHFGRMRKHYDIMNGLSVRKRPKVPFMAKEVVYAPRSAHRRKDYGKMDDLESWLFISVDLFDDSSPPWKPKRRRDMLSEEDMLEKKEQFFAGNKELQNSFFAFFPKELQKLVPMIYAMNYESKPNYDAFKFAFQEAKERIGPATAQKWKGCSADLKKYPVPKRPINNYKKKKGEKSKSKSKTRKLHNEDDKTGALKSVTAREKTRKSAQKTKKKKKRSKEDDREKETQRDSKEKDSRERDSRERDSRERDSRETTTTATTTLSSEHTEETRIKSTPKSTTKSASKSRQLTNEDDESDDELEEDVTEEETESERIENYMEAKGEVNCCIM